MKNQALFSSKKKVQKLKCHLLQFLCGTLSINEVGLFPNNPHGTGTNLLRKK